MVNKPLSKLTKYLSDTLNEDLFSNNKPQGVKYLATIFGSKMYRTLFTIFPEKHIKDMK